MYKLTIFTPTYNRGYIIENLYNSLKRQKCKDFEWIVIDDGSTDNTEKLFNRILKLEKEITIRYYKTKNGGKHRAINKALDLANGELFFIVDSDDYLTDDAVENIIKWEKTVRGKKKYAGISANRGKNKNEIIGKTFIGEYIDATSLERKKYNILGDKAEIFYTNILKKYRFPEIEGEKFITENTVWYEIANDGYKIRWFNEIIYICKYRDDGLTSHGEVLNMTNFKGYTHYVRKILKYDLHKKERIILVGVYGRTSLDKGIKFKEIQKNIDIDIFTIIFCTCLAKISYILKKLTKQIKKQ